MRRERICPPAGIHFLFSTPVVSPPNYADGRMADEDSDPIRRGSRPSLSDGGTAGTGYRSGVCVKREAFVFLSALLVPFFPITAWHKRFSNENPVRVYPLEARCRKRRMNLPNSWFHYTQRCSAAPGPAGRYLAAGHAGDPALISALFAFLLYPRIILYISTESPKT